MPVFGNRVVLETANYKHVQEFKQGITNREDALAEWSKSQKERKEKLEALKGKIIRSRRGSNASAVSRISEQDNKSVVAKTEEDQDAAKNPEPVSATESVTNVQAASDEVEVVTDNKSTNNPCAQCLLQ
jgi:hypothetical protein